MRARGGDLMHETIPMSGFRSCEATPGSGHLTAWYQLGAVTKTVPPGFLKVTLLEKGMKSSFVLITIIRYFKLSSEQVMSILRNVLSSSSHLIVKLD